MEEMKISEFKATCLAVLARVGRTGKPILVTRFGKPVAQVGPPPKVPGHTWLGVLRDQGTILGDLIEPASSPEDWEVLGDLPGNGSESADR
ncbi:MAG: type II toxin-antitoxin system Phd/YefM family antitoxin [Gammaproteobacteria bacterium]|nr:type II toxin-antitoxin system Phd/YefM family antitoxin [Gammaproteobacteria bacterium]